MSLSKSSYDNVVSFAANRYDVRIKFKDESILMRILGKILFMNPRFMSAFVTTIGSSVFFPSRKMLAEMSPDAAASILCHELIHVIDSRNIGHGWFGLSYLFPQCLAALALSAFFVGPMGLLFLLFLAPLPSPFRTFWELRGYAMTDAVSWELNGTFVDKDLITNQFTSGNYYFMWPRPACLIDEIEKNRALIALWALHTKIPATHDILSVVKKQTRAI